MMSNSLWFDVYYLTNEGFQILESNLKCHFRSLAAKIHLYEEVTNPDDSASITQNVQLIHNFPFRILQFQQKTEKTVNFRVKFFTLFNKK